MKRWIGYSTAATLGIWLHHCYSHMSLYSEEQSSAGQIRWFRLQKPKAYRSPSNMTASDLCAWAINLQMHLVLTSNGQLQKQSMHVWKLGEVGKVHAMKSRCFSAPKESKLLWMCCPVSIVWAGFELFSSTQNFISRWNMLIYLFG